MKSSHQVYNLLGQNLQRWNEQQTQQSGATALPYSTGDPLAAPEALIWIGNYLVKYILQYMHMHSPLGDPNGRKLDMPPIACIYTRMEHIAVQQLPIPVQATIIIDTKRVDAGMI
jgi:hypothetical protein